MCDFRYPHYTVDGTPVKRIGNVDDVEVKEIGCYTVGHTGSMNFYFDGKNIYNPGEPLPKGLEWRDTLHYFSNGIK